MTEVVTIVDPDGITDDIGGEPVSLIGVHLPILPIVVS